MSRFNLPWPDPFGLAQDDIRNIPEVDGAILMTPKVMREERGQIWSLHREGTWDGFVPGGFAEEKASFSKCQVLRGFHGDLKTYKLLTCLHGTVQFAIVDARRDSPTYGRTWDTVLSDVNRQMVLIPPGVLNAHMCLSMECLFHYKQSILYAGTKEQMAVRWDSVGVRWKDDHPILSERDASAGTLGSQDFPLESRPRTVAVSGYFNPLHSGHLSLFREAKKLGDRLLVIVNNDAQVLLKGSVPFMDEEERLRMVCNSCDVDYAYIACDDDQSVCKSLEHHRPTVFANGGDVNGGCREEGVCKRLGIELVYGVGGKEKSNSSSSLIERAARNFNRINNWMD